MKTDSDVNPVYAAWKSSTGRQKEWLLQELIQKLERFAMAICWQRLPDHADSLDAIVNEAVWRALQNEAKFNGKSRFSTWFYRIVVNRCNTFLSDFKRKCEVPLVEEKDSAPPNITAKVDLAGVLDGLKDDEFLLFRMVAEGYTWAEIGDVLHMTRQGAAIKWRRLKEKLRDAL